MRKVLRVLDLFSGCGGFSAGLDLSESPKGRFETVGAIDVWLPACNSFESNFPKATVLNRSVNRSSIEEVMNEVGDVDIIVGGPPCQGFSMSGKRAIRDPRNRLVLEFLNAVELVSPHVFVMENVPGFHSFQSGALFSDFWSEASDLGYHMWAGILLASRYGVPQRRRRFFVVGMKSSKPLFPQDLNLIDSLQEPRVLLSETSDDDTQILTFHDATSDLPKLSAGSTSDKYASEPRNDYQRWARDGLVSLTEHRASSHRSTMVELIKYLREGESAISPPVRKRIPKRLRPTSGFGNSYRRIIANQPAPTITSNFSTPSSANCIHPRQDRSLSLREGARCQSFKDSFQFCGTYTEKRLLIGNAVPPLLAKKLGDWILRSLEP